MLSSAVGFFAEYDRFLHTSKTSPHPKRLNARHQAIFSGIENAISGARVLDIGSHDGRWAFACAKAGAKHVTGIEPRSELIQKAVATFQHYDVDCTSYEFVQDNAFEYLERHQGNFDIVLCLGFYYHTFKHIDLFYLMSNLNPKYIIIDTEVIPNSPKYIRQEKDDDRLLYENPYQVHLLRERVEEESMAYSDIYTREGKTLVGRPSISAIRYIAAHFGYGSICYDWGTALEGMTPLPNELLDYASGWRATILCARDGKIDRD